jgi:hypothetical protein
MGLMRASAARRPGFRGCSKRMGSALWAGDQRGLQPELQPEITNRGSPWRSVSRGSPCSGGRRLGDLNPGWAVNPNRISSAAP